MEHRSVFGDRERGRGIQDKDRERHTCSETFKGKIDKWAD